MDYTPTDMMQPSVTAFLLYRSLYTKKEKKKSHLMQALGQHKTLFFVCYGCRRVGVAGNMVSLSVEIGIRFVSLVTPFIFL